MHTYLSAQSKVANAPSAPFVGCKSDGQQGPIKAPNGKPKHFAIRPEAANRLAYYKAEDGLWVLAPRHWFCFETYGSSGSNLYLAAQAISPKELFSDHWKGFDGPAIQLSVSFGGTSGRFAVARTIARVFPARRAFVDQVISEGFASKAEFTFGPYPTDQLIPKKPNIVEYTTPPQTKGLGTDSHLVANDTPIRGMELIAGEDTDLTSLAIRLPAKLSDLAPDIIRQLEIEEKR